METAYIIPSFPKQESSCSALKRMNPDILDVYHKHPLYKNIHAKAYRDTFFE